MNQSISNSTNFKAITHNIQNQEFENTQTSKVLGSWGTLSLRRIKCNIKTGLTRNRRDNNIPYPEMALISPNLKHVNSTTLCCDHGPLAHWQHPSSKQICCLVYHSLTSKLCLVDHVEIASIKVLQPNVAIFPSSHKAAVIMVKVRNSGCHVTYLKYCQAQQQQHPSTGLTCGHLDGKQQHWQDQNGPLRFQILLGKPADTTLRFSMPAGMWLTPWGMLLDSWGFDCASQFN